MRRRVPLAVWLFLSLLLLGHALWRRAGPGGAATLVLIPLLTVGTLALAYLHRDRLSTWRAFLGLVVALVAVLLLLAWRVAPPVEDELILLAWILVVAVGAGSLLLLARRDASVPFLAAAWLLIPVILIGAGERYGGNLSHASSGELLLWGIPLLWAECMLCLGLPAFLLQFLLLVRREWRAR